MQCSDTPQTMVEVFFEDTTISECLKAQNIRALVDLETLYCSEQPLISLEGLQHFPNLVKIYVWQAPKVELDFSTLPNLRTVSVKGDDFDSLDLSHNTELRELLLRDPNGLSHLDLSGNTALETLIVADSNLANLMLPETDTLKLIRINGAPLSTLDLTGNRGLEVINLMSNQLTTLALPDSPVLRELAVGNNALTEITVPVSPKLETADFRQNPLMALSLEAPVLT